MTDGSDAAVERGGDASRQAPAGGGREPPGGGVRDHPVRDWAPLVAALVLLLAVAVFVLQNGARVRLNFLFLHGTTPLGVALLLAAVLGGLVSLLLGFVRRARSRLRQRRHSPRR
ncbi:MAG: lipopolysaccharide assembly protein LapA domain-containing protein [Actinomycetota bacterium]|nr:lipopolysaccharide assembly protein LapA domain-containing protein [Actinomycetota bacterium]